MKSKKKVLHDHKQVGKKFIPPMLQLGKFHDVQWKTIMIPELIWIALINEQYGLRVGAELSLSLPHEVHLLKDPDNKSHFFKISSYDTLTEIQKNNIVNNLESKQLLSRIKKAIYPMLIYYPKCPLGFLFENKIADNDNLMLIYDFKKVLEKMFDRWNTDATFVQANAINIAFDSGRLKVFKGLELADFPEVEHFPYTEKSKRVASSIRSVLNSYFDGEDVNQNIWPKYFWNKGLLLQKCEFINEYERSKQK